MADNKRIAKNTIFLYFRMIIIMAVSFYTSRVVLDKLGVNDYGLFNAVAGVVGMLAFLNNTLAKGTSRFLTFELGNGNMDKLKRTFSTAFFSHIMLMIIMLVVLETAGIWFLNHKLVIPEDRLWAAHWVYQFSLVSMCISMVQVPYTSSILSHEDMSLYAYLSIGEAVAKLLIVYILSVSTFDKMVLYAALLSSVQLLTFGVYYVFCRSRYIESALMRVFDKSIFKEMLGFCGWNTIAFLAESLKLQGSNILINMFFRPSLVAAQAVANQVTTMAINFVYQFTTALNPQIIKSYAAGDFEDSQKLTLQSTVFVFDLVLLICLPLYYVIEPLLDIWLVEVPEMTVDFIRITLISQVLGVFNVTFYTPMLASAKLKTNSIAGIFVGIGQFIPIYIMYAQGYTVLCLPYTLLATTLLYSIVIKPYILCTEIDYRVTDILRCFFECFKVLIPSVILSFLMYLAIGNDDLICAALLYVTNCLVVILSSIVFMQKDLRKKLIKLVMTKLKR